MSKFDWKKTLGAVAPTIATALGGPLAGIAVGMATKALGLESGDEGALAAAVASGDPNVLVKLKEVEAQFKLEMKRLDISLEELNTKDRDSARNLAIAKGVLPQVILSAIYTVGYFWMMVELVSGTIKIAEGTENLVLPLIGIMSAAQIQIMNFWFGSSAGSKSKDAQKV